jgi:hypothetical protein
MAALMGSTNLPTFGEKTAPVDLLEDQVRLKQYKGAGSK